MSYLSTSKNGITERRFWDLPALGPSIPPVVQADASDSAISTITRSSQRIHTRSPDRREGCLVTRFMNFTNELAHFVSAARTKERQQKIIHLLIFQLKVIPFTATAPDRFTLEHPNNMAWLCVELHRHHYNWSTIAISPCLSDMLALAKWFSDDNVRRQRLIDCYGRDPGRDSVDYCFKSVTLKNKFQLTILHPRHFRPNPEESLYILGPDGHSKPYWASTEGVLKDKDGVPLPPFSLSSRTSSTQLNPLLVNFTSALRFRRLKWMDPNLMSNFSSATHDVINASLELYSTVMWTPVLPKQEEGSDARVGSTDAGDVEVGADPSATSGGMEEPRNRGDADPGTFDHLFQTLGRMNAMDVILGGYDFEPLPDLLNDGENGVAFTPRPSTPDDEE
ncbi:hypothetical protein DFH09DRAFT_1449128 [Mycena vulgaris]|nr:hypothetical protein DFH09DRAFT_1449128 [Mycena vulgaris]